MLEDIIIVGLVMVLVEIVKLTALHFGANEDVVRQIVVPLAVFLLAGALNVGNALLFGAGAITAIEALAVGFKLGAMAGGIYSLGKAALGQS
uniref:Uncharacterized protein n=1 Tax=viral metagenome TaxID=1070528 RepID=A0A6M3LCI5_9ZZZZ